MRRQWLWMVAGVAIMAVALVIVPHAAAQRSHRSPDRSAGTAGSRTPAAVDVEDVSPATIREIETITGALDGHELIGHRVDLRLKATGVTSKGAFWTGLGDNKVLVVPAPETQRATPLVRDGDMVSIAGFVRSVPAARERVDWGLAPPDLIQLTDQKIYIRADRITP